MNLFGFEIRLATPDDCRQLCALFTALDEHRRPSDSEALERLIAGPDSAILVAEDPMFGLLIGFASVAIRATVVQPTRRIGEIDGLGVRTHARRQGVGRALIRRTFQWAADHGVTSVELGVGETNAPAITFCQAMGFGTVTRRLCASVSP